jgi:hypothetical protein
MLAMSFILIKISEERKINEIPPCWAKQGGTRKVTLIIERYTYFGCLGN